MIGHSVSKLFGSLLAASILVQPGAALAQQVSPQTTFSAPGNVQASPSAASDQNVRRATAVVNGTVITGTDVDHRMALLVSSSQGQLTPEQLQQVRAQVLRNLIDETLQMQEAAALELPVENAMVQQRYAEVAARNFGNTADAIKKMDASLLAAGSSPASLKRQIRGEIAWQLALRRNVMPFINVSDEEVREVLTRMEQDQGTTEYRIAEIFLNSTPETHAAVGQNALQIVEQIKQGGNFTAYARQFSESSTAAVGGDLGFVRLETLPVEMANQARQMQPGQLVGPIDIPGGMVIMLLIDTQQIGVADPRDSVLSLKQIAISMPEGVGNAEIETRLQQFNQAVQSVNSCDSVESLGQSIGAQIDANDVVARDLPAQLQASLLQMQVGQSTQPFGTPGDGYRVLMLCGRKDPSGGGLPDFETVRRKIEDDRIDKRAQRYLRDLRNDAYIELS